MGFGSNPYDQHRARGPVSGAAGDAQGITVSVICDDSQVRRLFEQLSAAAQERVLKPLMVQCAKLLADAMRGQAPAESGLLRKAIGASTVKRYPSVLLVTAEVRRGFRRAVTASRTGRLRIRSRAYGKANPESAKFRSPRKYVHLVVGGRKAVSIRSAKVLYSAYTGKFFGRSVVAAAPDPFVDRAFAAAQAQVLAHVKSEAPQRIAAEADRLAK